MADLPAEVAVLVDFYWAEWPYFPHKIYPLLSVPVVRLVEILDKKDLIVPWDR